MAMLTPRTGGVMLCPGLPKTLAIGCLALAFLAARGLGADDDADANWTMPSHDYAHTRFSTLDAIHTKNVKDLKVAWAFSTGVNRGQESAPLVVGDTMYVVTPYPNILYALDLKNDGALKWKYEPKPAAAAQGVACCDLVNRGAVYDGGTLYFNTLDDHVVAVDAKTGVE